VTAPSPAGHSPPSTIIVACRSDRFGWRSLGFDDRRADLLGSELQAIAALVFAQARPGEAEPGPDDSRSYAEGAIIINGCLYCPQTPGPLPELVPLPPGAATTDIAIHDQKTAELARYKPGVHAAADADGYRRHICPAAAGKIRCPLRPASMTLDRGRPEILSPPEHPQACCTQQTITAGPSVAAKTRHKHDYPPAQWRASYTRRTAAERVKAGIKDPAINIIDPGLDPPDGPHRAHAPGLPHGRAKPAHPRRLGKAAGTPRARRCPLPHPQTPPPARRRSSRPAITTPRPERHGSSRKTTSIVSPASATPSTPAHTPKPGNSPRQAKHPAPQNAESRSTQRGNRKCQCHM